MGGFQINGFGARDYFTKMKYLGEKICPKCGRLSPFYLEKGKFKVSVLFVPTVTLKERYAVLCGNCEQGNWIEEVQMHKIMSEENFDINFIDDVQIPVLTRGVCPNCGSAVDGPFCGICGIKCEETPIIEESKKICPNCGNEVEKTFCGTCGTKYEELPIVVEESKKICPSCGSEVEGVFCGVCGTKYEASTIVIEESKKICPNCGDEIDGVCCGICGFNLEDPIEPIIIDEKPSTWECSLCGTQNSPEDSVCSLCGCEKSNN